MTIEALETHIAPAALGQRRAETNPAVLREVGKIPKYELLLQIDRRGRHNELLAERLRNGNGRYEIRHGLADSGPRLDDADVLPARAILHIACRRKRACDVRDHRPLTAPTSKPPSVEPCAVGLLDLILVFVR